MSNKINSVGYLMPDTHLQISLLSFIFGQLDGGAPIRRMSFREDKIGDALWYVGEKNSHKHPFSLLVWSELEPVTSKVVV